MNELINKTEVIEDLEKDIAESDNWLVIALYMAFAVRIMSYKNIDAVEVVHGKWAKGVCDKCGFDWGKVAPIANVPSYCPNCGADMRGGIDE